MLKIKYAVCAAVIPLALTACTAEMPDNSDITDMTSTAQEMKTEKSLLTAATDFNQKICYGQGRETDDKNRPTGAVSAQQSYGSLGALFIGNEKDKVIYLTFDEGYENGYTADILDTLKEKNVKATFYVTLDYVKSNHDLVKRMIDEGHAVGNHTCAHPSLPDCTDERFFEEVNRLEQYISDNFGGYRTTTLRPPKGEFSPRTLTLAKNMGYTSVLWSFAYSDWDTAKQPDTKTAYDRITSATHNGAIYLLHAVSQTNTEILPDVIDYWQSEGYSLKTDFN